MHVHKQFNMNISIILNARLGNSLFTMTILFFFLVSSSTLSVYGLNLPPVGTVKVITHVINDNGGIREASDFSNCVDASSSDSKRHHCSSGSEQGNSVSSIQSAPFKVTKDPSKPVTGYSVSYSEDCSGSISIGKTYTCTVTYNDIDQPLPSNPGNSPPPTTFSLPKFLG